MPFALVTMAPKNTKTATKPTKTDYLLLRKSIIIKKVTNRQAEAYNWFASLIDTKDEIKFESDVFYCLECLKTWDTKNLEGKYRN